MSEKVGIVYRQEKRKQDEARRLQSRRFNTQPARIETAEP